MANEKIEYIKTNVSNNIFKDYWNTSNNKNAPYANKKTEEVDLSSKSANNSSVSTSDGIISINLGNGMKGNIDKKYIDFSKITDSHERAENGLFYDSNNVYSDYFDDNLEYEVENDGVVLLKQNGIPMGRTTVSAIQTKIGLNNQNISNRIINNNIDKSNINNEILSLSSRLFLVLHFFVNEV